jgi:hypothetical protein
VAPFLRVDQQNNTHTLQAMTPIASVSGTYPQPSYQRVALPRATALPDQVYDPVLDPAYQSRTQPTDSVQVIAKAKSADDEPFSFWDLLDVINPLQHIPGVNTIYRELTGDTIKTPIKMIGATVLGGPIGFAAAMADSIVEKTTGRDVGAHAMALLKSDESLPTDVPDAPAAQPQYARSQAVAPQLAMTHDEVVADPVLSAQSQQPTPSQAEAFVQTAQIAAQANVFPSFKRGATGLNNVSEADKANTEVKLAAAQAAAATGQMRFMSLRADADKPVAAGTRRDASTTSVSELRARTKFAPGSRGPGGPQLSPATLAAATAAQTPERAAMRASSIPAPSAVEAYNYGRQAAAGTKPAEVPAWFDQAMLSAIDKHKAMQSAP